MDSCFTAGAARAGEKRAMRGRSFGVVSQRGGIGPLSVGKSEEGGE